MSSILLTIVLTSALQAPAPARRAPTPALIHATTAPDRPATPPGRSTVASEHSQRRLRIGGFISLGVGVLLFGVMAAAAGYHRSALGRLADQEAALAPGQSVTRFTRDQVEYKLHVARVDRDVAIGTGIAAAVSFALAATLFTLARRPAPRRLALAPWWSSSGAGVHLRIRLP